MLLIDGLGLGVNWQRFLSETLNPVVAPPPPPPPPPKQDGPSAGPANPSVAPPIPVTATPSTDPSKPTNAEIASATSLVQSMAAQYTVPPPDITVENDKTRAVQKAIQDAQTQFDNASQSLQGAQNVLRLTNRDPESTPDDRKAAQDAYAKARTAADSAQRDLNVTTDAGYMILYGEQANADMPAGMKIDDSGKVTDPGDAQHAADQQFKALLAAFPDHANDPNWVPQPGDCKNPLQTRLYDDWQTASATAAVGASKYYADVANSNLAYTQFQSYLADPNYKSALDAGIGRLNDALQPLELQVTMPDAPASQDAAQQAVTAAAKDANYANAAAGAANDSLALTTAQQRYDAASGKEGPTVIVPNAVSDAKTALARAQTAANTSGSYLQMLSAQQQVDTLQADYTKKTQAADAWHKANPNSTLKDPQVDLDMGDAYAKLTQAQQQAGIAHDGFVATYGATLAQQYDDQASQIQAQVNARSIFTKPAAQSPFLAPPLSTADGLPTQPASSLSTAATATPTATPTLPTASPLPAPSLSTANGGLPQSLTTPFALPQSTATPAAPTGPTMLDAKRLQVVAGAIRAADSRLSDSVNERATQAALSQARIQQTGAKSTLASVQQQYDDWAAANPPPVRFRTVAGDDMIPAPSTPRPNLYQDQLDKAKAAVTQADNAVQRLQLLGETSHQQVLMDQFDAGLDERLRYAAPDSDAGNDYRKALHDFYEAHRGELSNSLLDAASASTQNGNTIAFGKLTDNEQRNLIGVALGMQPDVQNAASASDGSDPVSPTSDDVARFTDKDKLKTINTVRDTLLSAGGGANTQVSVLPMVYAAKDAGMTTSAIFKVTGKDGTQYVDETGSTYNDINDYINNNELSKDGTVDIATGHNADGTLQLVSKAAHHESGFDSFLGALTSTGANIGMMLGGMALEGLGGLLDGTGIGAIVGVPLNVLGATMMYTAIGSTMTSAGLDIATRIEHGRSINPFTDAGARADFINLVPMGAAGAAKLAGSKLFTRAVTALTRTPKVASLLTTGAKATALVTGVGGAVEAFGEAGVDYFTGNKKAAGEELKAGLTNVALMAAGGLKERAVTSQRIRTGRPVPIRTADGETVTVDSKLLGQILNKGDASSLAHGRTRATLDGDAVKVSPEGMLMVGDKILTYDNKPIRVLDKVSSKQMPPGETVVLGEDGTLSVVKASPKAWTNGTRVDDVTGTGERLSFGPDGEMSTTPNIVAKTKLALLDHAIAQTRDAIRQANDTEAQGPRSLEQTAAEGETASTASNARSTQRTSQERARVDQQHDETEVNRTSAARSDRRSADAQALRARTAELDEPAGAGTRTKADGTPPRVNVKVVDLTDEAPATRPATRDPAGIAVPRGPAAEPMEVGDRTVYVVRDGAAQDAPGARPAALRPQDLEEPVIVVAGEHDAALAPELANRWQKPVYAAAPDAFGPDGQLHAGARVLRFDPAPEAAAAESGMPGAAAAAAEEAPPVPPRPAADDTLIVLAGKRGPNEPALPRPAATAEPVSALDGIFSAPNRVLVLVKPERPATVERTAEHDTGTDSAPAGKATDAGADGKTARTNAAGERPSAANDDIGLAAAHPEMTETPPPDPAAPNPGWVTRMQMRFGGAALPEAAQALAMQSGTLATQLRMLQDAGWRVTLGKRGGGSRIDPRKRRVTIDGALQHPGSITYTLAHEARHAVEAMAGVLNLDYRNRSGFTRKALEAEARAQINAFEARYEIQLAGGGDIAAHVRLPDAIEHEGNVWRAPSHDYAGTVGRLVDAFADAPVSGRDGETYREFYNDVWARQKRRGGIPRRMPAPQTRETGDAPRGVRSFDERVAWSHAHAEYASPFGDGPVPAIADLQAARSRHFTVMQDEGVLMLHADTLPDGTLLAGGRPVGVHEYALDQAPAFIIQDGYSIVLSAKHGGDAAAAQLANLWQRPVYAPPGRAVGEHAALLDTGTFRRFDPAPAAPHDLGPLTADAEGVHVEGHPARRIDVGRHVGELLGSGGEKTVFALGHDAALAVYDKGPHTSEGRQLDAAIDESIALDDLASYGLQTLTMSGPFSALNRVAVLYRPLGVFHSFGFETGALPRVVSRAALEHIRQIREVVERTGIGFDLQGLFTRRGDFLLSDPGPIGMGAGEHFTALQRLSVIERALTQGLERGNIELAHPKLAETPAPDAFVQKPSIVTRVRMRFGGAPLPKEAYRLIDASSLLSQQLQLARGAGWKVVRGKPGAGSKIDTQQRRITIDGGLRSTGSMVYVLAHEAGHAVEAATGTLGLDYGSTPRYVRSALLAEARAQANAFAIRDEIRANAGVDIGRHVVLPEAIANEYGRARPGDAASIERLANAFEHAPTSLDGGITYGDLYRRQAQAAQHGHVTMPASAHDAAAALAAETAWSRARPVKASPFDGRGVAGVDALRLLHSDGLSYDREAGIVIVRGTTDAQGRLVDADGRPWSPVEFTLAHRSLLGFPGAAIILAARNGRDAGAWLANVWQRPVHVPPTIAVGFGPKAALSHTHAWLRYDPAPHERPDLGPLAVDGNGIHANGDPAARLPVERVTGAATGAGIEKTVFELGRRNAIGIYLGTDNRAILGHIESIRQEQDGLAALRAYGLKTLTIGGPFSAFDRVAVMYEPFASLSSHDVTAGVLPERVTRDVFTQLDRASEVTARHGLYYDFEGVFDTHGNFYLSDPSQIMTDAPRLNVDGIVRDIRTLRVVLEDGIARGAIELAHPAVAEHLPPDAFAQKPSLITRIRMRFGGAPLPKEAYALVDRSTLLSGQVALAHDAGWKVVVGRPGRGSRIDTAKQRIVLDGRLRGTGTLVYALAHEAQHAVETITRQLALDHASPDALTESALMAEARAQANAFAVRRELIDDAGIDIAKDAHLPDAIAREADRVMPGDEAGLRRLAAAFGDAAPSVPGHATYRDYYASQAAHIQAGGVPREMPAPAPLSRRNAPVPARAARQAAQRTQRALDQLASHGKRDLVRIDGDQLPTVADMKAAFGNDAHVLIAPHIDRPADRIDARHPQPEFVASMRTGANGKFIDKKPASDDIDPKVAQGAFHPLKSKGDASRKDYDYYVSPVPLDELLAFGGAARIEAYFGERRQWDVEPSATGAADAVVATMKQLDDAPRFQRPKQAAKHAGKQAGTDTTVYAIDRKTGKVLGYATLDAAQKWTYVETTSLGDATIADRELADAFRRRSRLLPDGRRGVRFVVADVAHDVVDSYGGFAPAKMRRALDDRKTPLSKPDATVQRVLGRVRPSLRQKNREAADAATPNLLPANADTALDFNAQHAPQLLRALELGKIPDGHFVYVYDHEGSVTDALRGTLTGIVAVENGTVRWYDDAAQFRDGTNEGLPLERATIGRGPFGGNQHFLLSTLAPDAFVPRATALKEAALQAEEAARQAAAAAAAAAAPPAARKGGKGNNSGNGVQAGKPGRKRMRGKPQPKQPKQPAAQPAKPPALPVAKPIALEPYQPAFVSSTIVESVTRYGNAKVGDFAATLERLKEWGKRDQGKHDGDGLTFSDKPQAIMADAALWKKIFKTLDMWREASSLHPHGFLANPGGGRNRLVRRSQQFAIDHGAARTTDRKLIDAYVELPADIRDRLVPMSRSFSLRDDPEQMRQTIEQYGGALPAVALQVDPYSQAAAVGGKQDPGLIRRARQFGDPTGARYDDDTATITRTDPDGTQRTLELDDLAHLHKWLTAASKYGFLLRLEAAPARPLVSLEDGHAMAGTNNGYAEIRRIGESLETWAKQNEGEKAPLVMLTFHGADAVLEPVPGEGHVQLLDEILGREQLDWVHVGLSWGTHGDDFIANADLTRALAQKIVEYKLDGSGKFDRLHGGDALTRVYEPNSTEDFANQQRILFTEIERIAKKNGMTDDQIAALRDQLYEHNTSTLLNQARRATNEYGQSMWRRKGDKGIGTREKKAREVGRDWLKRNRDSTAERPELVQTPASDARLHWKAVTSRKALQNDGSHPIGANRKAIAQPDQPAATMDEAAAHLNALRVHRHSKDPSDRRKTKITGGIVLGASSLIGLDAKFHWMSPVLMSNMSSSFLLASRLGRVFQVMHQGAIRSLQSGDPKAAIAALSHLEATLARQFGSGTHEYGEHRPLQLDAAVRDAQAMTMQYVEQYKRGTMSFDDAKANITALADDVLTQMQGFVGGTSLQQLHAGNPRSVLGISARAGMTVASVATLASGIGKIAGAHDWFTLALGTTGVASGVLGAAYAGASFVIVSRRVNADKRSRVVRAFDSAGDFASVALGGLSTVSQWKQGEVDLAVATATSTALLLAGRLNTHFPNATPLVKKIPTAIVMIPVAAFGYKFIIGVAPLVGGLFNWIFGGGGPSQSNLAPGALPSASPSASPSTSPSAAPSATPSPTATTSPSSQPQPSQGTPSSPPSPSNSPQPYIVVAGDSLWVIADRHRQSLLDAAHVSRADQQAMTHGEQDARALSEILQLNPSVAGDPGRLAIGTPLNVG
ncbi:peptidoglycan-binding protein [Burkholderia lata]|uniref:LWXIA domain-containing protein n=1 Tax=Burkholderia lata (strain ATCC 17760 / DSM 23089 / LMG 22485 / NCIMB 9086 / R18194 / 383) TaxID=482957 RepID=UPI0014545E41|nr:LWXIA domain-containing protein [Burkholderia lata]VWD60030.1 peptidoglycan-binding protein [Burkholderia lata]